MKKFIAILFVFGFIFSGCKSSYSSYKETTTSLDFREYVKQGFVIIPATVGFEYTPVEYTPISEINVLFYSGNKLPDDLKGKRGIKTSKIWSVTEYHPTSERILDKIVEEAKAMGANGIVNFKSSYIKSKNSKGYWEVSGVAVITKQ
jgi:uncharacterized protein YbjQ (UPF0145 family)